MTKALPKNLLQRIVSAVVIAVPAIAAIQLGAPYFNIFISVLGILMGWEWSKLCQGTFAAGGILLSIFAGIIPILPLVGLDLNEAVLISPVVAALLFAIASRAKGRFLFAIGSLYLALPICSFIFLRSELESGLQFVYWLALVVVATDTGGYAFGLTIGGPKLAPRISPKKTWAGLLGGMLSACIMGIILANVFNWQSIIFVGLTSAVLAVLAQAGDLFESHVKRTFDIKDSSNIIPGHGGVLDRMDGMLAAGASFAALVLATGGQVLSWF